MYVTGGLMNSEADEKDSATQGTLGIYGNKGVMHSRKALRRTTFLGEPWAVSGSSHTMLPVLAFADVYE